MLERWGDGDDGDTLGWLAGGRDHAEGVGDHENWRETNACGTKGWMKNVSSVRLEMLCMLKSVAFLMMAGRRVRKKRDWTRQ